MEVEGGGSSVTSASGAAREQDGGKRTKKKKAVPEQQMEPRAGKEEVEEKDGEAGESSAGEFWQDGKECRSLAAP